jgi:heme/copper-type cytochrome/quinol oxidase subunit 2
MDAWVWIVIAVAIVVLAVVLWSVRRIRQRRDLRDWFPPNRPR